LWRADENRALLTGYNGVRAIRHYESCDCLIARFSNRFETTGNQSGRASVSSNPKRSIFADLKRQNFSLWQTWLNYFLDSSSIVFGKSAVCPEPHDAVVILRNCADMV